MTDTATNSSYYDAEAAVYAKLQRIRVGANAVIVRDGSILLVEFDDESGLHFNLPGGGLQQGESIKEAAVREVREEASADVEVGRLLLVYEYYPPHSAQQFGTLHKVMFVFQCTLKPGSEPRLPDSPDPNQTGVRWVPLSDLPSVRLLPYIADRIVAAVQSGSSEDIFLEQE